jgi:hypothetical protein
MLHEAFGGNSRCALIVTVTPVKKHLKATMHSLQLASMGAAVHNRPRFNYARDDVVGTEAARVLSLHRRFSFNGFLSVPPLIGGYDAYMRQWMYMEGCGLRAGAGFCVPAVAHCSPRGRTVPNARTRCSLLCCTASSSWIPSPSPLWSRPF